MNSTTSIPQTPNDTTAAPAIPAAPGRPRSGEPRRRSMTSSRRPTTVTERMAMLDEMLRLRDNPPLQNLLNHYRELGLPDRSAWQDRLCELDGVESRELARLHGELIAFGWVEQNTGVVPTLQRGAAPGCYRITPAGLRALKQLATEEIVEA